MELGGAEDIHHTVEDAELAGGEGADHDAASAQALRAQLDEARLGRDVREPLEHRAVAAGARLVDLREQRVGRVRDDRGDDAGDHARAERDAKLRRAGRGG